MRKGDLSIAFKAVGLSDLPTGHKRVATALLEHYNRTNRRCDPSMDTLATLLQLSERSIVRAVNRLVEDGYFKRFKHGGNFYCNQYEPIWTRFREVNADWARRRDLHRSRFDRTKLADNACQSSQSADDSGVTQTCPTNNHSYETFSGGLSKKEIDRTCKSINEVATNTMELIAKPIQQPASQLHVKQPKSSDAARNAAERRWSNALTQRFSLHEQLFAHILSAIDPALSSAATDAELAIVGDGIKHILAELHRRGVLVEGEAPQSAPGLAT
ncbi:helix-turn-helix domain-containing protein [Pseudorhodoplanes sinuspersici]|uniref:Uncharacterized protein n=1 Tax=Pseudorhodoplanes sinuspersici TaxID=1235591 RepID=A0A1W6ZLU3_9HYPH|nr:helix-turn-helix domain-containing protein [Pseudorhodoplanes sinuspersici]ARP98245.1 hypothetical protein CAK95_03425 [Pseudorhodoplanes sinuspersici]RKE67998.1 helix-turn-helix protein [Pseudorhodoplanes sinuspersici]